MKTMTLFWMQYNCIQLAVQLLANIKNHKG